jgi:transposase
MRREPLEEFAKQLSNREIVVVEATGNAASVAAMIGPHVSRVVIANPKQVRLIAHAKIKTDKIDAGVLAQLYASGFLPEVWIADETTQALRRQVTRRNQIVRQRSRLKNIIQSILHAHLIPSCPHQDLCGPKGRAWLSDRLTDDLKVIERNLAQSALADERAKRLGHVRRCTPESCAISSSKPITRRPAGRRERHTPTTSKASATRNGAGSSRPKRPTPVLSQVGMQGAQRRARAPQGRGEDEAARQGFHLLPCSLPRGHPCAPAD